MSCFYLLSRWIHSPYLLIIQNRAQPSRFQTRPGRSISAGVGLHQPSPTQSRENIPNARCLPQGVTAAFCPGSVLFCIIMHLSLGDFKQGNSALKELIVALAFQSYSCLQPGARPCSYKLKWVRQLDKYTHKEPGSLGTQTTAFWNNIIYNLHSYRGGGGS